MGMKWNLNIHLRWSVHPPLKHKFFFPSSQIRDFKTLELMLQMGILKAETEVSHKQIITWEQTTLFFLIPSL